MVAGSISNKNRIPIDINGNVSLSMKRHRVDIVANGSSIAILPSSFYALPALIGSAARTTHGRRNLLKLDEWACMLGISLCLYDERFRIIGTNKNPYIFMSLQAMAYLLSFFKRLLP